MKKAFLSLGKAHWSGGESSSQVNWQFIKYKNSKMPFYFYECYLSGFEKSAQGFGCAWHEELAIEKAFSESWERLWFLIWQPKNNCAGLVTSSNGFASRWTDVDAAKASRAELIERAVLIAAWTSQQGWKNSTCRSFRGKGLLFALKLMGWHSKFYTISSSLGEVKCCLLRHSEYGSIFDSAFLQPGEAVDDKLILSVAKNTVLPRPKKFDNMSDKFPLVATPDDHQRFYACPKNNQAFEFLDEPTANSQTLLIEDSSSILTEVVAQGSDFPVVCYSHNPNWPPMAWGQQTIQGLNQWPHPLA
jgi:hypothetical protein